MHIIYIIKIEWEGGCNTMYAGAGTILCKDLRIGSINYNFIIYTQNKYVLVEIQLFCKTYSVFKYFINSDESVIGI